MCAGDPNQKPGEWHFDTTTRTLYIYPPDDVHEGDFGTAELILTQTPSLIRFIGSGAAGDDSGTSELGGSYVKHISFTGLKFAFTSTSFFRPHEETSGGDYAIHRGAAIYAENASALSFADNTMRHLGGNAIFLSNAVSGVSIERNMFQFLGTSGVCLFFLCVSAFELSYVLLHRCPSLAGRARRSWTVATARLL